MPDSTTSGLLEVSSTIEQLVRFNNRHDVDTGIRMLKIAEEYGEATQAYLGYLGANPRKGYTNDIDEVWKELADTAIAALVAIESLGGDAAAALVDRLRFVAGRLEEWAADNDA